MNKMRFGALLLNAKNQLGLYLSHRVVLALPEDGCPQALSQAEFAANRVFAFQAVAYPFAESLLKALQTKQIFHNNKETTKFLLDLPENVKGNDLYMHIKQKYNVELEDFSIRVPKSDKKTNPEQWSRHMQDYDYQNEFLKKFEAEKKLYKRPNILVCGYTGSGKTSLIQAMLGEDLVPSEAIGVGQPKTMGYDCYENNMVRIFDSRGLELGETEEEFLDQTKSFLRERQADLNNVDEHIHLVWYTIQGSGARVTKCDLELIKNIFSEQNVLIAFTKADLMRNSQRESMKQVLLEAGIDTDRIFFTSDIEGGSQGCMELMHKSLEMLPEAYKDAFIEAQRLALELRIRAVYDKAKKAKSIIATATAAAGGIGATPIPLSDAALLIPIQVTMIASLAALYGLREEAVKQAALPFLAKVAGIFAATSLLKLLPVLGSAVNAAVAASITGAMGLYVKNNFEQYALAKVKGEPTPEFSFNAELFKQFFNEYEKKSLN
ncbi:MAG: hypothetical protein GX901_10740 [Lentisphaerae bacterium]|nr:hypothetical protein [Lentisphaerota bacterium]